MLDCPGPVDFDVLVYDLPAKDAALPVATTLVSLPEAVQPVTLPSAIVSESFPSFPTYTTVAPGLRIDAAVPKAKWRLAHPIPKYMCRSQYRPSVGQSLCDN